MMEGGAATSDAPDYIMLQCAKLCNEGRDMFYRNMFVQFSIGVTPPFVSITDKDLVFYPVVKSTRASTAANGWTPANPLDESLQQRLDRWRDEFADVVSYVVERCMLPTPVEPTGGRRINESVLIKHAFSWSLTTKTVLENYLVIPILVEWHCQLKQNNIGLFRYIESTGTGVRPSGTRNNRIMTLLHIVEQCADDMGICEADKIKCSDWVYGSVQNNTITPSVRDRELIGWVYNNSSADKIVHVIPPQFMPPPAERV